MFYLTIVIYISFFVTLIHLTIWARRFYKWLCAKMLVGDLLWSPEELKRALDTTKDGTNGKKN